MLPFSPMVNEKTEIEQDTKQQQKTEHSKGKHKTAKPTQYNNKKQPNNRIDGPTIKQLEKQGREFFENKEGRKTIN